MSNVVFCRDDLLCMKQGGFSRDDIERIREDMEEYCEDILNKIALAQD